MFSFFDSVPRLFLVSVATAVAMYHLLAAREWRDVERKQILLECGGTADDLGDLLGDLRLTSAVESATQHVEHLTRVVGRVLHRRAARALLAGSRLDERAINRVAYVRRE